MNAALLGGSPEIDEYKRNPGIPRLFMKEAPSLRKSGDSYVGRCPLPTHQDLEPSFSVYRDPDGTWLYKCWGRCKSAGNIFQFQAWLHGTEFSEALQEVKNFLGRDKGQHAEKQDKSSIASPKASPPMKYNKAATIARFAEAEAYLKAHGVSPEVAKSHDVGVDDFLGVGTCIVFPYNDDCAKLRGLRRKDFRHYPGTSTAGLFYNLGTIDQDNPKEIFITESERDCLMMVSHGFPAISVSSATACINSDGSVKFKPEDLEKLRRSKVYIAVDQDEDGKECAAALQKALAQAKILTWHYGGKESIDPKDLGELYERDPGNFKDKIARFCEEAETSEGLLDLGDEPTVEPEIAQSIDLEDVETLSQIGAYPLTDAGNGERMVAEHGNNIRYLNDDRGWRVWDGSRWNADKTSEIARLAKDTIRKIGVEAFQTTDRDGDQRKSLAKWSLGCESRSRLDNMVTLASREEIVSTNSGAFDQSPWLFNCANGTIDLENNIFRQARREDLLSKRSPVIYDPKATCPRFDVFLTEILPSPAIRRFLQASLGYTLSGHSWEKFVWFLIGEKGDNGKTTLIEAIRHVFGDDDYAANMNFNSLLHREGQGPSGDLARLRGVRFVSACESDQGQKLSASILKRLTGADKITAAFKYRDEAEFTPALKLWLATNHPPQLAADDDALWRRIVRIPFDFSVPLDRQDPRLQEKLSAEGPGILNWTFEGWKLYRTEGLKLPEEVRGATELYREVLDVCKDFLKDCVVSDGSDIGSTKLYQAFKSWFTTSHNQRQQPMSQKMFSTRLEQLGYHIERRRDGSCFCGVGRLAHDCTGQDSFINQPFL